MNDGSATADQHTRVLLHAEGVLCAGGVGVKGFGMDVQTSTRGIDVFHRQQHVAQADQPTRSHLDITVPARNQRAMHRHGLRTVFGQMHGVQAVGATQRVIRQRVAVADGVNGGVIPADDGIQQAHRALMWNEVRPVSLGEHAEPEVTKALKDSGQSAPTPAKEG